MGRSPAYPTTLAIRALEKATIGYRLYNYPYMEKGGAPHAAASLDVDLHCVIKTLVMETDGNKPLLVLMHGDREVSTKALARFLKVKRVAPCSPEDANRLTGYQVGGISPFGIRSPMPVYMEAGIVGLERIFLNAGKRGWLAELDPKAVMVALSAVLVEVGIEV